MKKTYEDLKLDCLVTLGGNGTHKTANLLSEEGLNVIGLPKTIDNDIYGTDFTFGFHTACEIATDVIDRLHTTAASHGRVIVVEIMGNKAGWLTLYSGMAGGADAILLPEIPYDIEKVAEVMESRARNNKAFSIIAVAEGAMDKKEAKLKRKEREAARKDAGFHGIAYRIAEQLQELAGVEARAVVPGHIQRGGTPCAYDRVLSTQFGVHAADLIKKDKYGYTVTTFETSDIMYQDVLSGNSVACFEDTPVMAYAISNPDSAINGKLKIIQEAAANSEFATPYGFAVAKGKNAGLLQAFNDGLKSLKDSGEYDKIVKSYVNVD